MAELRPEGVSKTYPSGLAAARNVSLTVAGATWARMRPGLAEPELPSSAPAGQGSDQPASTRP